MATAFTHEPYNQGGKLHWYGHDISLFAKHEVMFHYKFDGHSYCAVTKEEKEFKAKTLPELIKLIEGSVTHEKVRVGANCKA